MMGFRVMCFLFVFGFVLDASRGDAVGCASTIKDLTFVDGVVSVICPAHCQAALVTGTSIHPASSPVCASAIADGVLPVTGGTATVTALPRGLASYTPKDTGIIATQAAVDVSGGAFHVYATDSLDQIRAAVRVVDTSGFMSNSGLLQIRTDAGFGSVCGMNQAAADVVCRQMGYDFGSVGDSCATYGGEFQCGATGTPVAMQQLVCTGGELDVQECSWTAPDASCSHDQDAIVYCAHASADSQEGDVRLLSAFGSPSIDGEGRVEVYRGGSWAPVCSKLDNVRDQRPRQCSTVGS